MSEVRDTGRSPLPTPMFQWFTNLPTPRFRWQQSAGICGQHGVYVGPSCPKCVTQVKP